LKYLVGALLGIGALILLKKLLNWLFGCLGRDNF